MEDTESHASCIVCQLSVYISLLVVLLYLLSFNSKCLYFIKMTGIYLTIILNAVIVCCCWPLYFFGDVSLVFKNSSKAPFFLKLQNFHRFMLLT